MAIPKNNSGQNTQFHPAAELESLLGSAVDPGLLSPRNLVYATQVAVHGVRLFTREVLASDRFLPQSLAQYSDLQVAGRAVLQAYAAG